MEQRNALRGKAAKNIRGVALFMTLIMMFILTISALGMMMMMNSGVSAAGNIAFRQAAVRLSDLAVEDARTWLSGRSPTYLQSDDVANGYYANYQANFQPQTFDFATLARPYGGVLPGTASGYNLFYVVHRMATTSGVACSDPNAGCLFPPNASSSGTTQGNSQSGGVGYNMNLSGATGLVYYRVTIKVVGARYNNRYIQAFFY